MSLDESQRLIECLTSTTKVSARKESLFQSGGPFFIVSLGNFGMWSGHWTITATYNELIHQGRLAYWLTDRCPIGCLDVFFWWLCISCEFCIWPIRTSLHFSLLFTLQSSVFRLQVNKLLHPVSLSPNFHKQTNRALSTANALASERLRSRWRHLHFNFTWS